MGKHSNSEFKVVLSVYLLLQQHVFSLSCTEVKIKYIVDFTKVPTYFDIHHLQGNRSQC
jgi:hypothetical protein